MEEKYKDYDFESKNFYGATPISKTQIIRYTTLHSLLDILIQKRLYFVRGDQFTDQLDGLSSIDFNDLPHKELAEDIRMLTVISCWNKFKAESFALWHIYSNMDRVGVAIKSTVKCFKDSIMDSHHRKCLFYREVKYVNETQKHPIQSESLNPFVKKKWYEFEKEIRFSISSAEYDKTPHHYRQFEEGLYIQIEPAILIKEVILSPHFHEWFIPTLKEILKSSGLDPNLISTSKIKDSKLNR